MRLVAQRQTWSHATVEYIFNFDDVYIYCHLMDSTGITAGELKWIDLILKNENDLILIEKWKWFNFENRNGNDLFGKMKTDAQKIRCASVMQHASLTTHWRHEHIPQTNWAL